MTYIHSGKWSTLSSWWSSLLKLDTYLFCISGGPFFKMRNLAIKMSAKLGCVQIEWCDTRPPLHRRDLLKRLSKPYFPFENCHTTFWTKCGEKLNCGCRSIRLVEDVAIHLNGSIYYLLDKCKSPFFIAFSQALKVHYLFSFSREVWERTLREISSVYITQVSGNGTANKGHET